MLNTLSAAHVYLVTGYTDMRKSINGLSLIISEQLDFNPYDGSVFVFCNKGRDKLKILYWEHNGFWLYYRRLDKGKFQWPAANQNQLSLALSYRELSWLLSGLSLMQKQAHQGITGFVNN